MDKCLLIMGVAKTRVQICMVRGRFCIRACPPCRCRWPLAEGSARDEIFQVVIWRGYPGARRSKGQGRCVEQAQVICLEAGRQGSTFMPGQLAEGDVQVARVYRPREWSG